MHKNTWEVWVDKSLEKEPPARVVLSNKVTGTITLHFMEPRFNYLKFSLEIKSPRRELNSRPPDYKSGAIATKPRRQWIWLRKNSSFLKVSLILANYWELLDQIEQNGLVGVFS